MKNLARRIGPVPLWMIGIGVFLFLISDAIVFVFQCSYDDVPNAWTCVQPWAATAMGYLDVITLVIAYPIFIVGALLALFFAFFRDTK